MVIYIPTKVYVYNFVIVWMMQKFDFQQQNEVQSGYTYQVYVVRVLQKNICKINCRSNFPKQKVLGERYFSYIAIGQSCLTIFWIGIWIIIFLEILKMKMWAIQQAFIKNTLFSDATNDPCLQKCQIKLSQHFIKLKHLSKLSKYTILIFKYNFQTQFSNYISFSYLSNSNEIFGPTYLCSTGT